jgi:hypothetical protein
MRLTKEQADVLGETLRARGYKRYSGHYKSEDYGYWKSFERTLDADGEYYGGYQLAILFYDFSKYPDCRDEAPVGTQYEIITNSQEVIDRLDVSICDHAFGIEEAEAFAHTFYQTMFVNYFPQTPSPNV